MKKYLILSLLPLFLFINVQAIETIRAPETVEELEVVGERAVKNIPYFLKWVFRETINAFIKIWEITSNLFLKYIWSPISHIVVGEVEYRIEVAEEELERKTEGIKESLWERFKNIIRTK